jgi:hypothetical protein
MLTSNFAIRESTESPEMLSLKRFAKDAGDHTNLALPLHKGAFVASLATLASFDRQLADACRNPGGNVFADPI